MCDNRPKKTLNDIVNAPIVSPVEPVEPTDNAVMVGLLRDRVNDLIDAVNVLADEVAKLKKA